MKALCRHDAPKYEYRVMRGLKFEGMSIREVYYDENDKLIGWNDEPLLTEASNVEEIKAEITNAFKDLDDMLEATKKPVLEEIDLEIELGMQ